MIRKNGMKIKNVLNNRLKTISIILTNYNRSLCEEYGEIK